MKKEEKTAKTRDKILTCAREEFAMQGYDKTSITAICKKYEIAKGLIYHNFESKDEIYLFCVKESFLKITAYMNKQAIHKNFKKYMEARVEFFKKNPLDARIFFEVLLNTPLHLEKQVKSIRFEFDEYNKEIYQSLLKNSTIRNNISEQEVYEYYDMMQNMFNMSFQTYYKQGMSIEEIVKIHEEKLWKMIDIMLYGLCKEEK